MSIFTKKHGGIVLRVLLLVAVGAKTYTTQSPSFERDEDRARYQVIARKNRATVNSELFRAIAAHKQDAKSPLIARGDLVRERRIRRVMLSPDGRHAAYLLRERRGASLWVLDTRTLGTRKLLHAQIDRLFGWSSDNRHLFFEADGVLSQTPIESGFPKYLIRLGDRLEARVEGIDGRSPHHVFVSKKLEPGLLSLVRIDLDGGEKEVFRGSHRPDDFLTDANGEIAFVKLPQGGEQVLYKLEGKKKVPLANFDFFDSASLLSWDEAKATLWLRARLDGDLIRIYKWKLGESPQSVFKDPMGLADIHGAILDRETGTPIAAVVRTPNYRTIGITPAVEAHLARIRQAYGDAEVHVSPSPKGGRWLVQRFSSAMAQPGFALYDPATESLTAVLEEERAKTAIDTLANLPAKLPFSFRAGDDRLIHGYLTLPAGSKLGESPLVVLPHGGPFAQTVGNYDELVQLLANRGFLVAEPNFRGSTGYGLDYTKASNRDFGRGVVHQDIVDSVFYLLSIGLGDAKRLAIYGHSFGGFSAFAGLAFNPGLFQLGIASAPPPDLASCMDALDPEADMGHGIKRDDALKPYVVDLGDVMDVKRLMAKSPKTHAAKIGKPVLVLAGKHDRAVPVDQVRAMALKLAEGSGEVSLFVAKDEGHNFSNPLVKRAAYYLIEKMLADRFGTRFEPLESRAVTEILRHSMELDGHPFLPAQLDSQP